MKTILWATLSLTVTMHSRVPKIRRRRKHLMILRSMPKQPGILLSDAEPLRQWLSCGRAGGGPFAELDIVVVSKNIEALPGVTIARSPQEALN